MKTRREVWLTTETKGDARFRAKYVTDTWIPIGLRPEEERAYAEAEGGDFLVTPSSFDPLKDIKREV